MQSNRFFATVPSSHVANRVDDSMSLKSTLEEVLTQLKEQNTSIKYIQEQNDQALCLGEPATRFIH